MDTGQVLLFRWARRHLRWLLCLALVLPAAQLAGVVHAFSHLETPAHQRTDGDVPLDKCPICQLAAAVGGGALPSAPATPAVLAAAPVLPSQPVVLPVRAIAREAQRNRGPPLLLL